MKVAQVNEPKGRAYSDAFAKWKQNYHFPQGKEAEAYFDACILCAQHPEIADAIIA